MTTSALLRWSLVLLVVAYIVVLTFDAVTRHHRFTPDGMNYVDVARHIVDGRGISQATLGFNQPRFSVEAVPPVPMTTQAPLYPLVVAALDWTGIPLQTAALLGPLIAGALVLLLLYLLAARVYAPAVGFLTVALALTYTPFRAASMTAWSETIGTSLVLLSLWWASADGEGAWPRFASGLCAGLAFATRYALCPFVLTGLFLLFDRARPRASVRRLGWYALGAAVPAALVVGRNLALTGTLVGWRPNPSQTGIQTALIGALRATLGQYMNGPRPRVEAAWLVLFVLFALAVLAKQGALRETVRTLTATRPRLVLLIWPVGYLLWLSYAATRYPIDEINPRFIVPAAMVLLIPVAAFLGALLGRWGRFAPLFATVVAAVAFGREAQEAWAATPYTRQAKLAQSERLTWIERHATSRDLIVGEDVMDVPFYFGNWSALSFSPYPLSDNPEYPKLMAWVRRHGASYSHLYLILRHHDEEESRRLFGPFIADLVQHRVRAYPGIVPLATLADGEVFELELGAAPLPR